jgi:hypothetical protein
MEEPAAAPGPSRLLLVLAVVSLAASAGAMVQATLAREAAEGLLDEAKAAARSAGAAKEASESAAKGVEGIRADMELLAAGVDATTRQVKELADAVNFGGAGGNPFGGPDPPPAQPFLEFTPELRESLRAAAAKKGIELLEDRVSIPGVVVLRQGPLEFFAVLPGSGKTHESVIVLTGKPEEEGAEVEGIAASLNSCLMALGLKPGTPFRLLPGGRTIPATGSPVHLAVEWEEDGKPVRARAEDLLWDRENERSMEEGKFLYVGSYFAEDGYLPDLCRFAVAIYSVPTCVVDLDDPRAANDTIFMACGPRIPAEGTPVRLVFSPKPLPPTRTWDPKVPDLRTDGGAPAPPKEGGDGERR